jgi:protein involved in polysaccharide export with SLBB domain
MRVFLVPLLLVSAPALADTLSDLAAQKALMQASQGGGEGAMQAATPPLLPQAMEVMGDPATAAAQMTAGQSTPPIEEPIDPKQYRTNRGDSLELNFWGRQNLRLNVTVDPEGRVFVPKIGYITLSGHTLAEARGLLQAAVRRYYPGLQFDMSLSVPRSFLVHVIENVTKPGAYMATPLTRVSTIVAKAGVIGTRRRIEIRHRDGRIVVADILKYEILGDREQNPFLEDGDIIRIAPEGKVATITGPVMRPGRYELVGSGDFGELLTLAGGFKSMVTHQLPIRVNRRAGHDLQAEIRFAWKGDEPPMFDLKQDDEVIIPALDELQRSVLLVGALAGAKPGREPDAILRMQFIEGDTVRRLIDRAGGLTADADMAHAYIDRDKKQLPVDLEALLVRRDFSKDLAVELGDSVVIPRKRRSVMVDGSIFHPGVYEYRPNFTTAEYINQAGGPSRDARSSSSYHLLTADGKQRKNALNLVPGPGDTIVVPDRAFSRADVTHILISGASVLIGAISVTLVAVSVSK